MEVNGLQYCGSCKTMAVKLDKVTEAHSAVGRAQDLCKEAKESLTMALLGIFCLGFILPPAAVVKGIQARRLIRDDEDLKGDGMALAGIVLGIVNTLYSLLNIFMRIAS